MNTDDARPSKSPTPSQLSQNAGGASAPGTGSKAQKEPSVDFELDVKVDIESGKCILHPKEPKPDAEPEPRK